MARGEDLSSGPCIGDRIADAPDWVVDVAHDPREPVDEDPSNQCPRYLAGDAHHFVELAPDGKLIRTR